MASTAQSCTLAQTTLPPPQEAKKKSNWTRGGGRPPLPLLQGPRCLYRRCPRGPCIFPCCVGRSVEACANPPPPPLEWPQRVEAHGGGAVARGARPPHRQNVRGAQESCRLPTPASAPFTAGARRTGPTGPTRPPSTLALPSSADGNGRPRVDVKAGTGPRPVLIGSAAKTLLWWQSAGVWRHHAPSHIEGALASAHAATWR